MKTRTMEILIIVGTLVLVCGLGFLGRAAPITGNPITYEQHELQEYKRQTAVLERQALALERIAAAMEARHE